MNWGSSAKSLNPRLPIRSAMNEELKVYLVGGVVRDALIAEQVADLKVRATASDRDWVVVGWQC